MAVLYKFAVFLALLFSVAVSTPRFNGIVIDSTLYLFVPIHRPIRPLSQLIQMTSIMTSVWETCSLTPSLENCSYLNPEIWELWMNVPQFTQ